jgi:hypothetical protein
MYPSYDLLHTNGLQLPSGGFKTLHLSAYGPGTEYLAPARRDNNHVKTGRRKGSREVEE